MNKTPSCYIINFMRMTQKDIAKALGLSLITVSRALNDSDSVTDETKQKIKDFARDNHYVPHLASQILVRNRVCHLSLFSSTLPYYFWRDIRKGINLAADQILPLDYRVSYNPIPDRDTDAYLEVLKQEIEQGADAIAIVNQPIYNMEPIFSYVRDSGLPFITFNVDSPNCGRLCYVGPDYYAEGRLAAEVIGRTLQFKPDGKVLVIGADETRETSPEKINLNIDRLDGFTDVIKDRFPKVEMICKNVSIDLRPHHADAQMDQLMNDYKDKVDAVYLIPAINAIFLESLEKYNYNNTITLVHDLDESAMHYLDSQLLTAVIHQNPVLQGYYAVKMLERIMDQPDDTEIKDVDIVPIVIYAENQGVSRNYFAMDI